MPLDWTAYDAFDWGGSSQVALDPARRIALADQAAEILRLPEPIAKTTWGAASPPGRYAATVIRVEADLLSALPEMVNPSASLGLKLFKTTADARREAERLLTFHREQLANLPGLPQPRVQRSFACGRAGDRAWILLEWLPGVDLEVWRSRYSRQSPAPETTARRIIQQLLGEIVLPLWSRGLVWWDFRDANCCVEGDELGLLDVDSLAAYADEILERPTDWTQRARGRVSAEGRLRNMTWRLLQSAGRAGQKQVIAFRAAWDEHVAPVLATIGQATSLEQGLARLQSFLAAVFE